MWKVVSYRCLVVLVSVQVCSTLSEGAVIPCFKHDAQFRNRTLWARMGGTVNFTFCAESSVRVFERINISHPNHRNGWYPQPAGVEETLEAQVRIHHHTCTVTIKLKELQHADIGEPFAVTLFAADVNGTRINDTSTFFFDIEETVFVGNRDLTPRDQCVAEDAFHVADFNSIEILKPCLTYLLQLSPVRIVRMGETRYIDIQNWTEVRLQSTPYRVPCLIAKQQLADPVITWFTLQPWADQRETIVWQRNLLDRNNTSVTIPETKDTLNMTCQASGYPTPKVVILRDNETLEMSPDGISWQLNHTFYGEFICRAKNVLKSESTHIRVLVSTTERLKRSGVLFDGSRRSVVLALELGFCLIMVVILLVFAFLCLRRQVNREHGRTDVNQGQVESPMVETQTGSNTRNGAYPSVDDSSNYPLPRPQ